MVERAREIERSQGFDPLSEYRLDRARERHAFWGKKFNRQVALAFLYGVVAFILLGVTVAGGVPDGTPAWFAPAITAVVLALFGIAIVTARRIRKHRAAEIGAFIAASQELNEIHRRGR